MIFEGFVLVSLLILLALGIFAVIFLGGLESIDTDNVTLSVVATESGASLDTLPIVVLQFVTPGNGVIMSLSGFTVSFLHGGPSAVATKTPIPQDVWPAVDMDFPVIVSSNFARHLGRMIVGKNGILTFYMGPQTTDLFPLGEVVVENTTVSWTV